MEGDQNGKSNERIETAIVEGGAVVGQNDGVIGDTDNPKNQKNHDRTKTSQGRTKLEDIPSHGRSRSMHNLGKLAETSRRKFIEAETQPVPAAKSDGGLVVIRVVAKNQLGLSRLWGEKQKGK